MIMLASGGNGKIRTSDVSPKAPVLQTGVTHYPAVTTLPKTQARSSLRAILTLQIDSPMLYLFQVVVTTEATEEDPSPLSHCCPDRSH